MKRNKSQREREKEKHEMLRVRERHSHSWIGFGTPKVGLSTQPELVRHIDIDVAVHNAARRPIQHHGLWCIVLFAASDHGHGRTSWLTHGKSV